MKTRLLAFLLHHANCDPWTFKSEFYLIKSRLLHRYGTPGDFDFQVFEGKKCFGCNGSGKYLKYFRSYSWKESYQWVDCYKCDGTGWYRPASYSLLQRWIWHGYHFHQPIGRRDGTPPAELLASGVGRIEGYISKRPSAYTTEALYWLFLFYNRPVFFRLWRMLSCPMPKAIGPIVTIKRAIFYFREDIKRRREHLDFGQLPEEPKATWVYDDDLPF